MRRLALPLILLAGAVPAAAGEFTVFAAASLAGPLDEVAEEIRLAQARLADPLALALRLGTPSCAWECPMDGESAVGVGVAWERQAPGGGPFSCSRAAPSTPRSTGASPATSCGTGMPR